MKMFRYFLCAIGASTFLFGCNSVRRPKLQFDHQVINVGEFRSGTTYEGAIVLRNIGDGVLIISDVTTDCSCTVADIPKKDIRPGDSLSVLYKVNPHTLGFFQQQVIIQNNTDSSNPVMFVIRGKTI
jgi:hypothetical protein